MERGRKDQCWVEASFHFKNIRVGLIEKGTFEQRSRDSEEGAPAISQESTGRDAREGDGGRGSQRNRDNQQGGGKDQVAPYRSW